MPSWGEEQLSHHEHLTRLTLDSKPLRLPCPPRPLVSLHDCPSSPIPLGPSRDKRRPCVSSVLQKLCRSLIILENKQRDVHPKPSAGLLTSTYSLHDSGRRPVCKPPPFFSYVPKGRPYFKRGWRTQTRNPVPSIPRRV
eukprot:3407116-Pleurochrysis_carterae.AAC.2